MTSPAHESDAHALIRETSQLERALTERELRGYLQARSCHFLAKFTGLPYEQVVEIYEQEQERNRRASGQEHRIACSKCRSVLTDSRGSICSPCLEFEEQSR